jgi:hypothetical protein
MQELHDAKRKKEREKGMLKRMQWKNTVTWLKNGHDELRTTGFPSL